MLVIEHLTKRFGSKLAVDDLSLRVRPGELYGFLGPNGAGKTTTIKCVCGLLRPTTGRVVVAGHDAQAEPLAAKAALSYVPDQPYLYEKLTGREFLAFTGRLYGLEPATVGERIERLVETFDSAEWIDELTENYSHGMRQRVVLSAALIHEPRVIVVDEPMVGLDPRSAKTVKTVLRERVAAGCAVLMSTHTLSVAEEVADRIGITVRGHLLVEGTCEELRAQASTSARLEDVFLELTEEGAASEREAAPTP